MIFKLSRSKRFVGAIVFVAIGLLFLFSIKKVFTAPPPPVVTVYDETGQAKNSYNAGDRFKVKFHIDKPYSGSLNFAQLEQRFAPNVSEVALKSITSKFGSVTPTSSSGSENSWNIKVPYDTNVNYVDITFEGKFSSVGSFDLNSNFDNCSNNTTNNLNNSKITYTKGNSVYEVVSLNAVCINVLKLGNQIIKTTFRGPRTGLNLNNLDVVLAYERTANFEAGDTVVVVNKIIEREKTRTDYKITDLVPSKVTSGISYSFFQGKLLKKSGTTTPAAGVINFFGPGKNEPVLDATVEGENYLVYSYKI